MNLKKAKEKLRERKEGDPWRQMMYVNFNDLEEVLEALAEPEEEEKSIQEKILKKWLEGDKSAFEFGDLVLHDITAKQGLILYQKACNLYEVLVVRDGKLQSEQWCSDLFKKIRSDCDFWTLRELKKKLTDDC